MAESDNKKYHHGDLRNALLKAGLEQIEQKGAAGLSLRSLAATVGVSHTAPKNHFGSHKGLMTAIGTEGFRLFAQEMRAGLTRASSRKDRLHAALTGYVRFAQAHPELFRTMFSPDYCDMEDLDLKQAARDSYSVLEDVSRDLDWDKAGADNVQRRTEVMLWSFVHGYATLLVSRQFPGPDECTDMPGILDALPDFNYLEPAGKAR